MSRNRRAKTRDSFYGSLEGGNDWFIGLSLETCFVSVPRFRGLRVCFTIFGMEGRIATGNGQDRQRSRCVEMVPFTRHEGFKGKPRAVRLDAVYCRSPHRVRGFLVG